MHKNANFFENYLNPVMLVLIGQLSLSTLIFQGFGDFPGFLHYFVLAKLATSSIRVKILGLALWSKAFPVIASCLADGACEKVASDLGLGAGFC